MRTQYILVAVLLAGVVLTLTACGSMPLLGDVSFSKDVITPNADGDEDVALVTFDLSRSADISIYFDDAEGNRYTFRDRIYHGPSVEKPYTVYFSGVVNGYGLPDEAFEGFTVEKRVLKDGAYTWTVEATDARGHTEQVTGTLVIADADTSLPELRGFSVFPPVITPNRDSISDRATIVVDLKKDVEELNVYLIGEEDDTRYFIQESEKATKFNEAGYHEFDYDAGVDLGAEPPPDGTYTVIMEARDKVGQWTKATSTLEIENGGVPRAYILNAEVEWSGGMEGGGPNVSIPLDGTLYFTLTVENDSTVPIRTSGPPPGTVYDSDQNYATLDAHQEPGVFRVGIHCETSPIDHPWRWAIGGPDDLEEVVVGGNTYYYLPADARAVVSGGIRFVDVVDARNPQYCYASLIHEDVEISLVNYRVDAVSVFIESP
ncbi:MAG: hypothetical protein JXA14_27940 [Anaerolineae bacterium]|nr:hypothetical protein [Anaerolineae bacterium]